ncbi:hypothetical protein [Spirillospora sp. CA-128828]|uniref:hypothetical protein n=1 Tax=Spirillospora sp. CA-128828 TaxID=3240033 RepID=UPI003D8ED3E0
MMGDGKLEPERERDESGGEEEGLTGRTLTPDKRSRSEGPDVFLDVPLLKVDEISLEVENLDAHVSLVAEVLDLLKLNVGADVFLGRVKLEIKGVEAQAQLEVRLDNVALIVDRVLTTLDRNPEILQHIGRGVESAARNIGAGTGTAVGEVGKGARGAVEDVGHGAGEAVESVGEGAGGAVESVGEGAGGAVKDVGKGAGGAAESVGEGAGGAVQDVGKGTGRAAEEVGKGTGEGVRDVGKGAGGAVEGVGEGAGGAVEGVGEGAGQAAEATGKGVADTAEKATGAATGNGGDTEKPEQKDTEEPKPKDSEESKPKDSEEPEQKDAENPGASDDDEESTALQTALHETEESVRDLGRALLRMVSQRRGDE